METLCIKKGIRRAKVKSLIEGGDKAITRAYLYKVKGMSHTSLHVEVLYFSKEDNELDELVRKVGNKYVYLRTYSVKLSTLADVLTQLGVIGNNITTLDVTTCKKFNCMFFNTSLHRCKFLEGNCPFEATK